jgi:uncharacterized protein (TIGR03083 family)
VGGVGDELVRERAAFRETLIAIGPDAPTACGSWTTSDLAVHVAMGELGAGLPSYLGRLLVGSGVRVDVLASSNASMLARQRRRRDFDWALERLERDPPRVQRTGRVGAVSLLEVWAHHEDARAGADAPSRSRSPDLDAVLPILVHYQRRALEKHHIAISTEDRTWFAPTASEPVRVDGAEADLCRWLAGRSRLDSLAVTGPPEARAVVETLRLSI